MSLTKNPIISLSRLLGMFMIILCHTIKYYTFIPGNEFLGQIFGVGVHLFFFVSGYLYGERFISSFGKWYAQRFFLISFPAIIVAVLVMMSLLLSEVPISANTFIVYALDLEGVLFLNNGVLSFFSEIPPLGHLWFTTIIMLCYLLISLLQKAKIPSSSKTRNIFVVISLLIGIAVCFVTFSFVNLTFFFLFIIAYFLGKSHILNNIRLKSLMFYTGILIVVIVGRLLLRQHLDGTSLYLFYVGISNYILGTWPIVFLAYLYYKRPETIRTIAEHRIIKWFDNNSYYIYLLHGIFCSGELLNFYNIFSLPLATIVFCSCTILGAIILKWICNLITKPIISKLKA